MLLPAVSGDATKAGRYCYEGQTPVLPGSDDGAMTKAVDATRGGWRCYRVAGGDAARGA
jgi:hypothetical protein